MRGMTDKNEEAMELDELLSRALEPKGDPPIPLLNLEALGMGVGSKALRADHKRSRRSGR